LTFVSGFKKNPFRIIIALMIAYVAFAFYADLGKLSIATLKVDYLAIPLIVATVTAANLLLGVRFHRFLNALDMKIAIKKSILIYLTGLSLAVTPGSSGQVIKSQILKKRFGYAISKTSPIVLVEKWNELCAALLILIICVGINPILESLLIIMIGSATAIFLFGIMRHHSLLNSLRRIILRIPRLKLIAENIESSQGTLKVLSSKKLLVEGIVITLPAMILQVISVYFTFNALGMKISFIASTQIFYVSLISGILSFLPGGLGVTEGSMTALLLKYCDHSLAVVASAVICVRLVTLWYPTFLGIIISQFVMKNKTPTDQGSCE
jgi:glycosyltransferase 2 family protein